MKGGKSGVVENLAANQMVAMMNRDVAKAVEDANTVFPHLVSALEYFSLLNSFRTFMYCDL